MKKLNEQRLQVGDIILTSGSNKISKAVRSATNSDISHAMIYVQHSSVIDATAEGVHLSNIQRIFFEDDSIVVVLRPRVALNDEIVRKITDFARAATGTEYSKSEAVAVVARRYVLNMTMAAITARGFCSCSGLRRQTSYSSFLSSYLASRDFEKSRLRVMKTAIC